MNDHSIARFGWKAQIKSLKEMSALEQQIEKGVTNEFFPNEQNETLGCVLNGVPEDSPNFAMGKVQTNPARDQFTGDTQRPALFIRLLDQPKPSIPLGSAPGQAVFNTVGCNLCHTQSFTTPASSSLGLSRNNLAVNLFSDLLVHHMGACQADNIVQGTAWGMNFAQRRCGVSDSAFSSFTTEGRPTL